MNRLLTILAVGLVLVGCNTDASWTPEPNEPRAFVTTLGSDTVAVEVYTRGESMIEGIMVDRIPYTYIVEYAAELDENERVTSLRFTMRTPAANPDGPAPQSATIEVADGVAIVTREGGQNPGTTTLDVVSGTLPTLGRNALAMFEFEQVASMLHGGMTDIFLLGPTGSAPRQNASMVVAPDTVAMDYFGSPRLGWTDDQGQLLGVSGAQTTNKSESRRVEPFLVGDWAERWAAQDVAGTGIGTPSPGATVTLTVDGANLEVNYSQPAKRGRDIWGQLVPEGQVWRTGANAATHFTTGSDLVIDGQVLPAGIYTLWSVYQDNGLTLIFNSQTNQWGTQYDEAQDVFRSAMIRSESPEMSERFVISVVDTDAGGSLIFDWDTSRFSLPFTVR